MATGANYVSGAGGGVLTIQATTLSVDGQILANGEDGHNNNNWDGGGGAGGSLWIDVGLLEGSGVISASGGSDYQGSLSSTDAGYAGGRRSHSH